MATEKHQVQYTIQVRKSLEETQSICKATLEKIVKGSSWQSDVVEAINRSYEQGSLNSNPCALPAKMQKLLRATNDTSIEK